MPAKVSVKKPTKSAQQTNGLKPVKKTVKKNAKILTWADIQEGFRELQELHKETERTLTEANKRTEETLTEANKRTEETLTEANKRTERTLNKAIAETEKTLNKAIEESNITLNKAIGGLSNTLGSLVEHIMTPDLPQKFKKLGYSFNRIVTYKIAEGVHAQIDGMLENGEQAVAVEVKTTLRQADIDEHLVRMEKIRKYADEHNDKRQFMGAIAATITDRSTREYALKKGLFVIEPSGENVKVTKPEGDVRVW